MQSGSRQATRTREIRLVLVDDHALLRSGLRQLLEQHGVDVVGEASDGPSAVQLVRDVAPDVVLMDVSMPGITGIETTMRIRAVARRRR
jgi:DNA-binding NarL/FixJ family response regulator